MSFNKRLTDIMRAKGLSCDRLGKAIGVSGATVHKWQKGGSISDENLVTLAAYLGYEKEYLKFGVIDSSSLEPELADLVAKLKTLDPEQMKAVTLMINSVAK